MKNRKARPSNAAKSKFSPSKKAPFSSKTGRSGKDGAASEGKPRRPGKTKSGPSATVSRAATRKSGPHSQQRHEKKRVTTSEKRPIKPSTAGVLLWGVHAVREALLNPARRCHRIWATDAGRATIDTIIKEADSRGLSHATPTRIERADLDRLLPRDVVHQGIAIDVDPLPDFSLDDLLGSDACPSLVLVLDQVTDPHNVGAILRSAAAFGAGAVIVTERNAPGTTGTLAKTACGAAEHVKLISVVNLSRALDALRNESFWCIGMAEEGEKDLSHCALNDGRIALVLGAEGEGLRRLTREHCDELARLPTGGPIGSLNVSNAAAVSLYEVKRQRNAL